MLKIVMINHNTKEVGTYFRCLGFAKELAKKQHQVYFFCLNAHSKSWLKKYCASGINFIELPWIASGGIAAAAEHFFRGIYIFFYILFTPKIRIVHSFNAASPMVGWSTFLVFLIKGIKKIKLVVDWDDWWGKGGLTTMNQQGKLQEIVADFFETKIPLLADRITLHNDLIRERAIKYGVKPEKITKIYNGADIDAYRELYQRGYNKELARSELNLPQEKIILFFGGAVSTSVLFLLNVAEHLKEENILLLIIGPIEKKISETADRLNLKNKVEFKGLVKYEDYKRYLFASDVLLLPRSNKSLIDRCTFPGRIGDYMMVGRPIVASDVGELSKVFKEDAIGLLAKSDDVVDFRDKILSLMRNKNLRDSFGKKALETGRNKYNWSILTNFLVANVYNN